MLNCKHPNQTSFVGWNSSAHFGYLFLQIFPNIPLQQSNIQNLNRRAEAATYIGPCYFQPLGVLMAHVFRSYLPSTKALLIHPLSNPSNNLVFSSINFWSALLSTFNRTTGSVFDIRKLNRQLSKLILSPSV